MTETLTMIVTIVAFFGTMFLLYKRNNKMADLIEQSQKLKTDLDKALTDVKTLKNENVGLKQENVSLKAQIAASEQSESEMLAIADAEAQAIDAATQDAPEPPVAENQSEPTPDQLEPTPNAE